MKSYIATILIGLALCVSAAAQTSKPAFYETGNAFLDQCDNSNPSLLSQRPVDRQTASLVCTFWVVGLVQGMGLEDQYRPLVEEKLTPAQLKARIKAAGAYADVMKGFGITGVSAPNGNICIPDSATNEQYKMIVIAYMKSNPTLLGSHAAILAIAALKTAWVCKEPK